MDWDTIDRMICENKDFKEFMLEITEDLETGRVKSIYDMVMSDDEMKEYIKKIGLAT